MICMSSPRVVYTPYSQPVRCVGHISIKPRGKTQVSTSKALCASSGKSVLKRKTVGNQCSNVNPNTAVDTGLCSFGKADGSTFSSSRFTGSHADIAGMGCAPSSLLTPPCSGNKRPPPGGPGCWVRLRRLALWKISNSQRLSFGQQRGGKRSEKCLPLRTKKCILLIQQEPLGISHHTHKKA